VLEKNKNWSDGVLVLKSQGMYAKKYLTQFLGFCHLVFPLLQHSNTPAFQYSNTPVLQVLLTSSFDKEGMAAVYQRW
jgi:hypothetical protein